MKKLHIMLDCDNVLNNCHEHWTNWLNEHYGLSADPKAMKTYDLSCIFPTLTREQRRFPLNKEFFSGKCEIKPGSAECVKKMLDDGHEVSVVTAHNNETVYTKFVWMAEHFPFLGRDDIIITAKKQKVIGDVLIDDVPENLEGGGYFKILFDAPYNRGYDAEANGMVRVRTLEEAYEIITKELT